ncbi:MAG: hypothetical protein J5I47_13410 [Vicingus serpentipes]|nr:hypothetical protein [Vicingus serpentipes]
METKVTLFELIVGSGGAIVMIISAWIHMRITVSALKTEMNYIKKELESEKKENKNNNDFLRSKIDGIFEKLTEIQVSIASNTNKNGK